MNPDAEKWWDGETFPPLSIYSGGMDFLVLTEPLLDRLENEESDVRLVRYKRQEEAEHCDHFWAADAVEWCFHDILADIEATRPRYPEEAAGQPLKNAKRAEERFEPGTNSAMADAGSSVDSASNRSSTQKSGGSSKSGDPSTNASSVSPGSPTTGKLIEDTD